VITADEIFTIMKKKLVEFEAQDKKHLEDFATWIASYICECIIQAGNNGQDHIIVMREFDVKDYKDKISWPSKITTQKLETIWRDAVTDFRKAGYTVEPKSNKNSYYTLKIGWEK